MAHGYHDNHDYHELYLEELQVHKLGLGYGTAKILIYPGM